MSWSDGSPRASGPPPLYPVERRAGLHALRHDLGLTRTAAPHCVPRRSVGGLTTWQPYLPTSVLTFVIVIANFQPGHRIPQ